MNRQCERCALRSNCGKDFQPHIDKGECGHDDGCASYVRKEGK